MFKLMGKEINAILSAQPILIRTYENTCLLRWFDNVEGSSGVVRAESGKAGAKDAQDDMQLTQSN